MKSVKELLDVVNPLLKKIRTAVESGNDGECYKLFDSPQPVEWITQELSRIDGNSFDSNKFALIEGLMDRIFPGWSYEIGDSFIVQDKGRFAVTVRTTVSCYGDGFDICRDGIATVYAPSIEFLELCTPKCASLSAKNAIKKLGKLFGKDLNREENIPIIGSKDEMQAHIDREFKEFKEQVMAISSKIEAEKFVSTSSFRYNQEIKKIINEK